MKQAERTELLRRLQLTEDELRLACLHAVADGYRVSDVLDELLAYAGQPVPEAAGLHRRLAG